MTDTPFQVLEINGVTYVPETAAGPAGQWIVSFVRRKRMQKQLDQCAAWLPSGRWDDNRWHPVGARLVPPAALAAVEAWLVERAAVEVAS